MATDKKSSVLVRSSLPEFLDTEGPKFQAFIRAYYEWLETNNQLTDRSKNLLEYTDIDRTQDEFIDWFRREILADFPKTILADKKLLYQRILDLYKSKGSENAYKLLFRVLYDEEIEFYYPGQDILKVSDGRWVKETSIRLAAPFVGNLEDMGGENITGTVSGATAKVLRVTSTLETGINVFELFLSGTAGTFEDNEIVKNTANTLSGVVISSTGPLQGVVIQFGGARHASSDRVSFTSASGTGASGIVTGTSGRSISPTIVNGGSGYRVNETVVSITGGDGSGAAFQVTSISNTETIKTFDDTISDLSETRIDANTFITSNTGSISANLAISNSSSVLSAALGTSNTTVGRISGLKAITRGSNFTVAPSVSALDAEIFDLRLPDGAGGFKGKNAQLGAELIAGSLTSVLIDTFGSGYNRSDLITISNITNPAAENAIAAPLVSGIVTYPGKYTDTKGFVSWNNKLQDNYYYQEFSYSLRTTQTVNAYREIVKNVTHSAGTSLFGDHRISSNVSLSLVSDSYQQLLVDNVGFQANTSFGISTFGISVGPLAAISSTAAFENDNVVGPAVNISSIASTADVSNDSFLSRVFNNVGFQANTSFGNHVFSYSIGPAGAISSTVTFENNHVLGPAISLSSVASTADVSNDSFMSRAVLNVGFQANTSFGGSILGHSIGPVGAISSTAAFENDNTLGPAISLSSIASTADVSNDSFVSRAIHNVGFQANTSFGGIQHGFSIGPVGAISSTTTFENDNSLEFEFSPSFITLTSIVFSGATTLGESSVQPYSSNTVLQLQSNTFNDSVTVSQIGLPVVE